MNKILTLALFALVSFSAYSQCSVAIPSTAAVISAGPISGSFSGEPVWLCPSINGTFAGNGNTYYLEAGATCTVTGNDCIVIMKPNSIVNITGADNVVYTTQTSNVINQGSGNTVNSCSAVTFDYTNAPSPGCAGVGVEELAANVQVQLMPNPVVDRLNITATGANIEQVRVFDMSGRMVLATAGARVTSVDMSGMQAGAYLVQVITDKGALVQRVVKS